MDRIEELTWKWLDGLISQPETDELDLLLASDPAACRRHVECCDLEAALRGRMENFDVSRSTLARILAAKNHGSDDEVLFELPPEWLSLDNLKGRPWQRHRVRQMALALTLLVAVGMAAFWYLSQPLETLGARIGHADTKVIVKRNDDHLQVESGFALQAGDVVKVPASSVASIHYDDGTRIVLGSDSEIRLEVLTRISAASKHLTLRSGTMTAHVAKQPMWKSMLVTTPTANFRVLGTRFMLEAEEATSRLDVIEGRVQVKRSDKSASIEVAQGQFAVADSRLALTARAIKPRVDRGLIAFYRFDEGRGNVVHDRSQAGSPLDLRIDRPDAVNWLPGGGLVLRESAMVASAQPAGKIIDACRKSNELSVEAWVKPTLASQSGPARIVTLSSDPSHRNFTLGHGGDPDELAGAAQRSFFIGRVRTTKTTPNGIPELQSHNDSVAADLAHVVYTRSADGTHHLYVDGIERASGKRPGDFSAWDQGYRLALGDEFTRDRPWQGEYFLVAIFSRALSDDDVLRNFRAGPATAPAKKSGAE